jgi:exoribonuclease R
MENAELKNRFEYHKPDSLRAIKHADLRLATQSLAFIFNEYLAEGREKALAMTKLEEAMFWANASIARQ